MIIKKLHTKIRGISVENTYLYFITRLLKSDMKKTAKEINKYEYRLYQIDIDDEIRQHLYDLTDEQLELLLRKKMVIEEYDVISDDTEKLYTYEFRDKALPFSVLLDKLITEEPPKIENLDKLLTNEELWAYTTAFYDYDSSDWIFTFKKILRGKAAVDQKDGNKKKLFKSIRTKFNTRSQKLELVQGETVLLDRQIDCIFYKEVFYIAKKGQFEQIAGLDIEFKKEAVSVVEELEDSGKIEGVDILMQEVSNNPAVHKKLVRIAKIGNYKDLTPTVINRMKKVCKEQGENLKIKKGKMLIENEEDIEIVLKMVADYFKKGEVWGKTYGTFAGKVL